MNLELTLRERDVLVEVLGSFHVDDCPNKEYWFELSRIYEKLRGLQTWQNRDDIM